MAAQPIDSRLNRRKPLPFSLPLIKFQIEEADQQIVRVIGPRGQLPLLGFSDPQEGLLVNRLSGYVSQREQPDIKRRHFPAARAAFVHEPKTTDVPRIKANVLLPARLRLRGEIVE